jgi:hypothetical protein
VTAGHDDCWQTRREVLFYRYFIGMEREDEPKST